MAMFGSVECVRWNGAVINELVLLNRICIRRSLVMMIVDYDVAWVRVIGARSMVRHRVVLIYEIEATGRAVLLHLNFLNRRLGMH